jgi:outer membrane protein assembly factor BamD
MVCAAAATVLAAGCGASRTQVPPGTAEADQFLFTRGQEELKERRWLKAREYFRQIVDNYPQSQYRPDAKLAVGDTYIGEDSTESLLLAVNEFKEFLTFYPTNPRADYAQYRLAVAYSEQMLAPERDQSATRDVIRELTAFIERYPNSSLAPEAKKLLREAKDRLSEASYLVGRTYYRMRWYPGAIDRFREVLKNDPEYTRRDAVYFHLAESLRMTPDKKAEALPYYERLLQEFEQSEFLEDARKRAAELKAQ